MECSYSWQGSPNSSSSSSSLDSSSSKKEAPMMVPLEVSPSSSGLPNNSGCNSAAREEVFVEAVWRPSSIFGTGVQYFGSGRVGAKS